MTTKHLSVLACIVIIAVSCLLAPSLFAQARSETAANGALELVVNYGAEEEVRLPSHAGVLEPLALASNQLEPVMLACSPDKVGEPVTFTPLDGEGEIFAARERFGGDRRNGCVQH